MNDSGEYVGDMIFDENKNVPAGSTIINPFNDSITKTFLAHEKSKLLLQPIVVSGKLVYIFPEIWHLQQHVKAELNSVHSSIKRFLNPHAYPVGLDQTLYESRRSLIAQYK